MSAAPGGQLTLWFVNGSGRPGKARVYHDATSVTFNLGAASTLAWMLAPAHPSAWILPIRHEAGRGIVQASPSERSAP